MEFSFYFLLCVAGILALFGLFITIMGVLSIVKGSQARQWPSTPGRIIRTEVVERREERHTSDGPSRTYISYQPVVEYEYTLQGQRYTGSKLSMIERSYTQAKAQKVLEKYPVGATVTVYRDPQNPGETLLETGSGGSGFMFIAIGVVVLGVAVLLATNIAR
jgi:hypothetical protein